MPAPSRPRSSRAARKARGIAVFSAMSLVLALAVARIATFFAEHGGLTVQGVAAAGGLAGDLAARPCHIDFTMPEVSLAAALAFAAMVALAFATSQKGERLENEATGAEHGDDRLATMREVRSFSDRKHFCNNVLYSQNCRMAMKAHDKKTKAVLDGRNLNCITLGISGLGKTFNLVWPDLMQSVGDALAPMPCGLRNIPAHFAETLGIPVFESGPKSGNSGLVGKKARAKEGKGERGKEKKAAYGQEAVVAAVKCDEARNRERVEYEGVAQRSGAQAAIGRALSSGMRAAKREGEPPDAVTGGYDVFNTDPKGDNVRDVGHLFEMAGYKVKVVDTIDFKRGLHVNPLAYIRSHAVDAKDVSETRVKISVSAPAIPSGPAVTVQLGDAEQDRAIAPGGRFECSAGGDPVIGTVPTGAMWYASAAYKMETKEWAQGELPKTDTSQEELDDAIAELSGKLEAAAREGRIDELKALAKQREDMLEKMSVLHMLAELGAGSDAEDSQTGCGKVDEAMGAYSYRRSSGTVEVEFKNFWSRPMQADVLVELDPALVVDGVVEATSGDIEWPVNADGEPVGYGTVTWRLDGIAPKRATRNHDGGLQDLDSRMEVSEKLVLHVHVMSESVADGVDLTKVVDCLVTNLKGTDAKSNGSEDPFWEDTKRLCFMSLVALLFERYGPQYRTLPEVMRLLDMALSDSGNPQDPSPLQCLMEMWEYARVYSAERASTPSGRFEAPAALWKKADNIPHSRNSSLALHCYHAFMNGAPETVQSIIISCQACLVNLVTKDARDFLSYDELELDTLGDPGQKQVIFCVTKDTNSPFDFLTALIVYLAIDLAQDKAYKKYGGKLPRHVRFILDEAANIGKIPILIRALAVVRSRNISISMYLQSKAQLALVYGEKEADVIFDNCTTIVYLGAQTEETREEMSKRVGTETVQTRRFQRSFNQGSVIAGSTSESISSNERRVVSASKMGRLEKGYLMLFIFNAPGAIFDRKFNTREHPYYAYINPNDKRGLLEPPCVVKERFDYRAYLQRCRLREGEVAQMG